MEQHEFSEKHMSPFPDVKIATDVTSRIRDIAQYLRHSPRETSLVFLGLLAAAIAWLVRADQFKQFGALIFKDDWQKISGYTSLVFFAISGALVISACLLIWKELIPPPQNKDAIRPTALKGPMAFGPHDTELFRRLGRGTELRTLLDWVLDDQIGLIVIKGESGAGKTSLLRAGLPGLLSTQSPPIEYHYWEAVPDQTSAGFLNAVRAGWATTAHTAIPQELSDLDALDRADVRRVIVLDQFEQLSPTESGHQSIFRHLKGAAVTAMPPHRITYIVAFRADFASTWLDFQYDQLAGRTPAMMPLRLFNKNQAKDIIAVIAEAAGFSVDNELVEDLVASMRNDEDRISPVDIGITLLALNERAMAKTSGHLDKGDYQIAGGAAGLFAEYVSSRLDRYRPDERSNIVQAMLEMADLSNDKRLAQGLPPNELATKVGLPAVTMERYLKDLASPQVRLLEHLSSSDSYRLSHERLIPALRQLAGLVLAEAEQADRTFNRAYGDWVAGQRSRKVLLTGRRLTDVVKYRAQLHWGADRGDKETFLKQSLTWRARRRAITTAAAATLLAMGYFGWEQLTVWQYKRDLAGWRLPTALVKSSQLTAFSARNDRLTNLRWLRCRFNRLVLDIPKVDDIEDLRGCRHLTSLALSLQSSSVSSLNALGDLKGLTALMLDLGGSDIESVDALKNLKGLSALTLDLSGSSIEKLDALKDLRSLRTLTLNLGFFGSRNRRNFVGSSVHNLDAIKDLEGLRTLTLDLSGSGLDSLDALKELKGLTALRLILGPFSMENLDALKEITGLNTLALDLSSSTTSLDAIKDLKRLTTLTLNLGRSSSLALFPLGQVSRVANLDALKGLKGLTTLTLDLDGSSIASIDALKDLAGLTTLTLDLNASSVGTVDALKDLKGLTALTLNIGRSIYSIDALKGLQGLTTLKLDLGSSELGNIDALKDLKGLNVLTLDLGNSDIDSLDALKGLQGLTTLKLNLGSSKLGNIDALKDLKGLNALTLDLGNSDIDSLDALKNLKGLTSLTINLQGVTINSLDMLKELKNLAILRLDIGHGVDSLDALKDLTGLTTLTLDLGSSDVGNLDALKGLKGLTSLTLDLGNSDVGNLEALRDLKSLTTLTLNVGKTGIGSVDALKDIAALTTLTLRFSNSRLPDLSSLQNCERLETLRIAHPLRYQFDALPNSVRTLVLSDDIDFPNSSITGQNLSN
jgi:hypothetical protein